MPLPIIPYNDATCLPAQTKFPMHPLLVILSLLAAAHSAAAAAGSPAPAVSGASSEYLQPHNQARAEVGVAPLTWNQTLSDVAARVASYQRIKFRCQFANLTGGGKYGANQLFAGGMAVAPRAAVESWVAEKKFYSHVNNTCAPSHPTCGVYTQVVWGKSTELGCSQATCAKEGTTLTICLYYPPGNVVGESPY